MPLFLNQDLQYSWANQSSIHSWQLSLALENLKYFHWNRWLWIYKSQGNPNSSNYFLWYISLVSKNVRNQGHLLCSGQCWSMSGASGNLGWDHQWFRLGLHLCSWAWYLNQELCSAYRPTEPDCQAQLQRLVNVITSSSNACQLSTAKHQLGCLHCCNAFHIWQ